MGRLENLPKWAQMEITRLESDVEYWKMKATAGPEDSNTFLEYGMDNTPLGDSPHVVFRTGAAASNMDDITIHINAERQLQIHGNRPISIQPVASNLVYVRIRD